MFFYVHFIIPYSWYALSFCEVFIPVSSPEKEPKVRRLKSEEYLREARALQETEFSLPPQILRK